MGGAIRVYFAWVAGSRLRFLAAAVRGGGVCVCVRAPREEKGAGKATP